MKKIICFLMWLFLFIPVSAYAQEMEIKMEMETEMEGDDDIIGKDAPLYEAYLTTANLNLRELPTTESKKYETVPKGTVIWVTDFLYEWYAVEHNGKSGYMFAEFLTPYTPVNQIDAVISYAETEIGIIELISWSEAKNIFKQGVAYQVIDVRTKITYWVASFSNGKHADVEPVTAEDTAAFKKTCGGKWSWNTRPILIVINGRNLAASISGMPHGGSTNPNNNMNGQVCIHFKESKTNNGNKTHEKDHQNAVNEAFNTASKW